MNKKSQLSYETCAKLVDYSVVVLALALIFVVKLLWDKVF